MCACKTTPIIAESSGCEDPDIPFCSLPLVEITLRLTQPPLTITTGLLKQVEMEMWQNSCEGRSLSGLISHL